MISDIERGSEEKRFKKRQKERFPLHFCELPFTYDRVHCMLPPVPNPTQQAKAWLQLQLEAWRKHPALHLLRPSNYAIEMEQARHVRSRTWWMIHPMSRFWMHWQLIIIVSNLMVIFVFPFYEAFIEVPPFTLKKEVEHIWYDGMPVTDEFYEHEISVKEGLKTTIQCCDGIFILHILFKFFTGYYDVQHNKVVMNEKEVRKRYLKTWLVPDLLSEVPVLTEFGTLFFQSFAKEIDYTNKHMRTGLYVYTFVHVFRLARLYDALKYLQNWLGYYQVNVTLRFYLSLLIGILVFAQWSVFFMVRVAYLVNATYISNPRCMSWTREPEYNFLDMNQLLPFFRQYVAAMDRISRARGSYSLNNILPSMAVEDIPVIVVWMWISLYFMIFMLVVFLSGYEITKGSQMKMNKVRDELITFRITRHLNQETYQRLLRYYSSRFECQYYNEYAFLGNLPPNLRRSIYSARCRNVLASSPLFKSIPQPIIKTLSRYLIEDLYLPHDVIYSCGSESSYLYLLSIGTVGVYLSTGEEVGHLEDGDFFGEMGIVLQNKEKTNIETVVALEVCQVFKLPRVTFSRLIKPWPRLLSRIRTVALERAQDLVPVEYDFTSEKIPIDEPLEEDDEEFITGTTVLSDEETSSSELDEATMKILTESDFNPPRKI